MMPSHNGDPELQGDPLKEAPLMNGLEPVGEGVDWIQALPTAIYTCDLDGYLGTWNESAIDLWGRTPEAGKTRWCGSSRIYRTDGSPLPFDECPMARTVRERTPLRGAEIVIERSDGSRRHVIPYPELLHDRSGQVVGAVNMLVDITDRRKAAEEQELASRVPIENPSPMLRLTMGRVVGFANPAAAEAILKSWQIGVGDEVSGEIAQLAVAALATGEKSTVEMPIDGRIYMIRIVPVVPARYVNLYFNDVTSLKQTEAALRMTEQRFQTLATNSPVAIFTKDCEGRYTLANPMACEFLGRPEGVEGLNDHELLPKNAADQLRAHDLQVMREGRPVEWEEWVNERRFLSSKFPLLDAEGNSAGVCGVSLDITARAEAQRLLRESELKFRTLANHAPVGIFLTTPDGHALFVNGSWCAMAGLTAEEAVGRGWTKALHPEDRDRVLHGWERAVGEHRSSDSEFRFLKPDGTVTWIQGSALRLSDAEGNHAGYIGSCVDITARKRSEAALAEITEASERKRRLYEGMLGSTPDLAYVFDPQHRFTYANAAILAMLGKTWDEAIGKTCLELGYEPWHAAMHNREIDEVVATKRPIRGEVPFYHGTQGRRIYDYIFTPVLGDNGEVEAIAGITRDVTERKLVEGRAEFLSELTGRLAPLTNESEIIGIVVEAVGRYLRAQRCHFVECIPEEDKVIVMGDWVSNGAPSIVGVYRLFEFGGEEWWQRCSIGKFSVDDVRAHPLTRERAESYLRLGVVSYGIHPFQADGKRTIVFAVADDTPRRWSDDELALLDNVLARVWPQIERSRSEAASRETRRQLHLVSDHVPALISYLDHKEVFHFANGIYREWFGVSPAELKGMPLRSLLAKDAYLQRLPYIARVLAGEAVKFEGPTMHRELGWRDLEISYVPDFGEDQQVRGFYVMAMDITERKQTQKQLERQALRLRLLWESAGVILTSENPEMMLQRVFGKISSLLEVDTFFNFMVNAAGDGLELRSSHGITEEQRADIQHLEFGQAVCGAVARDRSPIVACSIQDSDHPAVQLVRGYGIRAYACNPLLAGDELLGTLSFASRTRDRFEPDEIEFMETICHYVTAAYVRWRLVEDLRAGDRRKDEFLATLAHELRNPLAPIRTGLEVMRMAGGNAAAVERVRATMERQVEQLVTLVNDLLDVSRITRGKLHLRTSRVELSEVVRSAMEASHPMIEEAGHHLRVAMPEEAIYLDADPHRLAQVISNLLNNAAKYTDPGGKIALEVFLAGAQVTVRVSDNGIGIPAAMLDRIFEMFTQIDPPSGGDYGGLGIGLTLVKSLVEMHGGRVHAASAGLGQGCVFSIHLPVLETAISDGTPVRPEIEVAGTRRRVLVVDDNHAAADTLAMAVELMGHEVMIARDGSEGLELAASFLPEIVLMDLGMPVMDGWEAARQLRGKPFGKNVMLVALTGWGQDEDRRKTKEAGFDYHLVKPATPAAIRQLLESPAAGSA